MNKYLLLSICYGLLFPAVCNAQIIIGDLQLESTTRDNEIKITNISDKTIDNIQINGRLIPLEMRSLKPNEERKVIFIPIDKNKPKAVYNNAQPMTEKEKAALADLLGIQPEE